MIDGKLLFLSGKQHGKEAVFVRLLHFHLLPCGLKHDLRLHRAGKICLDEKLLSPQIVVEIYELLEEYHVMCDAYIQGDGFSERYCFEHMDEYAIPVLVQELVKKTRVPIDNMKEYIRKRNCMVDKLNLSFLMTKTRGLRFAGD